MNEPAGIWVRVSTGGQDEANQVPDITNHCTAHNYRIAKTYELNDKSASKGEQQAKQDEVVDDLRHGVIKVLVCWHSDRVERRGPEYLFKFLRQIKDAHGRIESTKEPLFGTEDLSGEAVTALNAVIAHQYSVHLSEQVKAAQKRIRANKGLVAGGTPWGYEIIGDKYAKTIVSTDLCRVVVPQIFARCADGDSCRTIARWLDAEGIPPIRNTKWSEASVHRIITNMTYAGRRQDEGDIKPNGKPSRKNRRTIMTCEAVISMDLWQRANDALHNRPRRGPGAVAKMPNRPMLAGLKCARCGGPMWRIMTGRTEQRRAYYRCYGLGPQRKGCGNMVPLIQTDTIVAVRIFTTSNEPYQTRKWIEGKSYDEEIANVNQDIRELAQNPLAEGFLERMAELTAKLAELTELNKNTERGYWEKTYIRRSDGSPVTEAEYSDMDELSRMQLLTVGEHFDSLDPEGKREYLKTRDIRVEKVLNPPLEPGASRGVRVVIDGTDHGVFAYPPDFKTQ